MFTKSNQGKGLISACEDPGKFRGKPVEPSRVPLTPASVQVGDIKRASDSMFDRASGNFVPNSGEKPGKGQN